MPVVWPLLIDPEGQASAWVIRQYSKEWAEKHGGVGGSKANVAGSAATSGVVGMLRQSKAGDAAAGRR